MSDGYIEIVVSIEDSRSQQSLTLKVSAHETVEILIRKLLVILKIPPDLFPWKLVFEDRRLAYSETIGSIAAGQKKQPLAFTLRRQHTDMVENDHATVADSKLERADIELTLDDSELANEEESGSQVVALDEEGEVETVADDEEGEVGAVADDLEVDEESSDFADLDQDVEVDEEIPSVKRKVQASAREAPVSGSRKSKATTGQTDAVKKKTATRRATVRYYNRMNPERVYPFLVMITKKMVERAVKEGTDQKGSAPFKVKLHDLVEIEPILPGCACYPPKLTTRLGSKDFVATFHVVPHMLGALEGAAVVIRQENIPLAEIKLEGKVVKTTWVLLSGFATFVLPFVLSVARRYRLDLNSQAEDGFDLYLTCLQFLLSNTTPILLGIGLGNCLGHEGSRWLFCRSDRAAVRFRGLRRF